MGKILDGLKSRADAINAQRVGQDESIRRRVEQRPSWVPDDHPAGLPYVSLAADYAGSGNAEAQITDGVTVTTFDPYADAPRLTDAQLAGVAAEAQIAASRTAVTALRHEADRAGGRA